MCIDVVRNLNFFSKKNETKQPHSSCSSPDGRKVRAAGQWYQNVLYMKSNLGI